jgi:hypothetical protein
MGPLRLSAKDEARVAKERQRQLKEKASLQKSLAKEAKARNKWRVSEAFRRALGQERETRQRRRQWKDYSQSERARRLKAYRDYLREAGARERERAGRLSAPRLVIRESPVGGAGFALRVGSFAALVFFLATLASGLAAGLSAESLLFFAMVVTLAVFGGALLAGWWLRDELSGLVSPSGDGGALGRMVDRVVDDGPGAGPGGGG